MGKRGEGREERFKGVGICSEPWSIQIALAALHLYQHNEWFRTVYGCDLRVIAAIASRELPSMRQPDSGDVHLRQRATLPFRVHHKARYGEETVETQVPERKIFWRQSRVRMRHNDCA